MKRGILLALGLFAVPALASAQVEVGLDAGFQYEKADGADDAQTGIGVPLSGARVGFAAGEQVIIETRLGFDWAKEGDYSATSLGLLPGVNVLFGDGMYVRGQAGLQYVSIDFGNGSESATQYAFGAGLGMRRMVTDGALVRLELGVDKALENEDDGLPSSWRVGLIVGVSAVLK